MAEARANGFILHLTNGAAALMTLLALLWSMDVHTDLGFAFFPEQFFMTEFTLGMVVLYLTTGARRAPHGTVPWYDWAIVALGVATLAWMIVDYRHFTERVVGFGGISAVLTGVVIVFVSLEGLRRKTGYTLLTVVFLFIAYMLVADQVPGQLEGTAAKPDEVFSYLAWQPNGIFGTPMKIGTQVVIVFIFLGALLLKTGGGEFITDIAMATMGRSRGGSAKIAVVASGLFGSISGSAVSNVASTGVITIPLMKRSGYSAVQAGAIEATASTGGQFMPPMMGAAAFLMAEFLEVPYAEVVVAAAVPAILYYFAVFVEVDLVAAKDQITVVEGALPSAKKVMREGWHFVLPFAVLLYALFEMRVEAEQAAIYACGAIVVLGWLRRYKDDRMSVARLYAAFCDTGKVMVELLMILAAAGMVIGILNYTTVSFAITLALTSLGENNVFLLLVIAAFTSILLGMGMPTSGIYVLLAALIVPALVETGVHPFGAHLFILYFGLMSMLTPPVALCAYTAAPIAQADPVQIGFTAMRFAWTAYVVPFLFAISPTLMLFGEGEEVQIAIDVAGAFAGIYLLSAALVGYLTRPLGGTMRLLLAVAGACCLVPAVVLPDIDVNLFRFGGIALGALLLVRDHVATRRPRAVAAE